MSLARRRGFVGIFGLALAFLCSSLLIIPQEVHSLKILELDAFSLPKAIEKHRKLLLVEFYSPDCGHCQALEPVLEEAAEVLKGKASVVKIDSRNAHDLNQKYGVRQTPTFVLFQHGKEVTEARSDLQGFRTTDSLVPYVLGFEGPAVKKIKLPEDVHSLVESHSMVVCGLFPEPDSTSEKFRQLAQELRGHVPFAAVEGNLSRAETVAEAFSMDEIPTIFIAKNHNYSVQHSGSYSNLSDVEGFIRDHSFPLVGNFSVLTYYRYHFREASRVYLFYETGGSDKKMEQLRQVKTSLERVATGHDDFSFLTVSSTATETERATIMQKSGLSEFELPALAVVSKDGKLAVAHSQLTRLTEQSMEATIEAFLNFEGNDNQNKHCLDPGFYNNGHDSQELDDLTFSRYELHVQEQKTYWGLDESTIREINEVSYKKALKRSWKDVLVVYTARWCTHALALERLLESLVQSGELKHLEEELSIVKVDVVLTPVMNQRNVRQLPALKYVSARYKDFPYWFGGNTGSKDEIIEFVETYHSMRHVEIPGEGPSPFSKKEDVMQTVVSALDHGEDLPKDEI